MLPPASEALSIEEAIEAYTINGAYLLGMEDIIGSIEVGKRADLVVLNRNLFDLSPEEIAQTRVLSTMMNGRVVHNDAVGWEDESDDVSEIFEDFDFCSTISPPFE